MRKSLLFLILIMCFTSVYAAEKDRLAVMDVTDETGMLDEKTIINVTDYIFTRFQGTGMFWMIPKSDRDTALEQAIEQTLKGTRKGCVDEKCQLSLVAQLQANFLINTKIKKLYEGTCNITISKFDVEKRAGVFSWDKKFNCSSKGIFDTVEGFNFKNLDTQKESTTKENSDKDKIARSKTLNTKKDPNWSEQASILMNWVHAKEYCDNLAEEGHLDWRLPTISELRTLIKGCPAIETTGDCNVIDNCLSWKSCRNDSCNGCSNDNYSKFGDVGAFWSLSVQSDSITYAWGVYFGSGNVFSAGRLSENSVRCVR